MDHIPHRGACKLNHGSNPSLTLGNVCNSKVSVISGLGVNGRHSVIIPMVSLVSVVSMVSMCNVMTLVNVVCHWGCIECDKNGRWWMVIVVKCPCDSG